VLRSGESLVVRGAVPAKRTRFPIPLSGEWREGTSPSLSRRTVRDSLLSYSSHEPIVGDPGRSVPVRRLRCQALICRPFAFTALVLMAGKKLTLSGNYPGGTCTCWSGPVVRTQHAVILGTEISEGLDVIAIPALPLAETTWSRHGVTWPNSLEDR
jgi:hypothetical protein